MSLDAESSTNSTQQSTVHSIDKSSAGPENNSVSRSPATATSTSVAKPKPNSNSNPSVHTSTDSTRQSSASRVSAQSISWASESSTNSKLPTTNTTTNSSFSAFSNNSSVISNNHVMSVSSRKRPHSALSGGNNNNVHANNIGVRKLEDDHDEDEDEDEDIEDEDDDSDELVDPQIDRFQRQPGSNILDEQVGSHSADNLKRDYNNSRGSNTMTNGPTRSKLSAEDIKIVLYLIIKIKPFKYIGDRSLSQMRKWEAVQAKYSEMKSQLKSISGIQPLPISVPTVRTLQRQLATAIRKAQGKRGDSKSSTISPPIDKSAEYYSFNFVTIDHPLADLERYVLELHEMSENFKAGRLELHSSTAPIHIGVSSLSDMVDEGHVSDHQSRNVIDQVTVDPSSSSSPVTSVDPTPVNLPPKDERKSSYSNLREIAEATNFEDIFQSQSSFQSSVTAHQNEVYSKLDSLMFELSSVVDSSKTSLNSTSPLSIYSKSLQVLVNLASTSIRNYENQISSLNDLLLVDLSNSIKRHRKKVALAQSQLQQEKLDSIKQFTQTIVDYVSTTDNGKDAQEALKVLNNISDLLK
ncbi:uncharacterized protein RJT21DRAFT_18758 [Scheffersomyces amazonensis]|uniref:uncharacterized protein n=1 Tax=Scheffersomyces amazonensis TaxID=1078765 RepID=UPI00315C818B